MSTKLICIYLGVTLLLVAVLTALTGIVYGLERTPGINLLLLSINCLLLFFGGRLIFMIVTTLVYFTLKGDESSRRLVDGIWGIFIWDKVRMRKR